MRSLVGLVALLAVAALPVAAQASCPPPDIQPAVTIEILDAPITYDFRRSEAEIGMLAQVGGARHASHPGTVVRGLTTSEFTIQPSIRTRHMTVRGGVCAHPVSMTLRLGYSSLAVLVQSEYPPGTCQHQAILDHEHMHVRVLREALARHLPAISQAARSGLQEAWTRLPAPDQASGQAYVTLTVMPWISAAVARYSAERDARNAALDTPSSYLATRQSCASW